MEVLLIAIMGVFNIVCFVIGAKVGQKVNRDETIEIPTLNPLEAWRKMEAKKEAQKEQDKIDTIMQNIECYDGTSRGQQEV